MRITPHELVPDMCQGSKAKDSDERLPESVRHALALLDAFGEEAPVPADDGES